MRTTDSLHMNGGNVETSYANNSSLQQTAILITKPIRERAITDLCSKRFPKTICIADLGCSSGPNALLVPLEICEAIYNASRNSFQQPPEIQVFLNDLPGNDFNSLFKLLAQGYLPEKEEKRSCFRRCYFTGVPGSFYHRLFPVKSLHLVHVSYSLHWLSQVPEGVLKSNKCNIYVAKGSPLRVVEAYHNQFHIDFGIFLHHRSLELVPDGRMILTTLGRRNDDPCDDGFLIY